jgi:ArsR family transcriptional regulator
VFGSKRKKIWKEYVKQDEQPAWQPTLENGKEMEFIGMPKENALQDQEAFAKICKALGHPARVKIVRYLKEKDSCICGKIVDILPLAQSTVSQHLKQLKSCGLVKGTVEGPSTCYCLDGDVLAKFKKMAEEL